MAEISFREGPASFGEMIRILEMQKANANGDTLTSMKIVAELMSGRTEEDVYEQDFTKIVPMITALMRAMEFGDNGPDIPNAFKDWK